MVDQMPKTVISSIFFSLVSSWRPLLIAQVWMAAYMELFYLFASGLHASILVADTGIQKGPEITCQLGCSFCSFSLYV